MDIDDLLFKTEALRAKTRVEYREMTTLSPEYHKLVRKAEKLTAAIEILKLIEK